MAPTIKKIVKTTSKENSRENSWRTQREFSLNKTNLISMYYASVMCIRVAGQAIHIGLLTIFLVLIGKLKKKLIFFTFKGKFGQGL